MKIHIAATALALVGAINVPLFAQARPDTSRPLRLADSSVSKIMQVARTTSIAPTVLLDVIRQRAGSFPVAKRRALADSIANLIVRGGDSDRRVLGALDLAGRDDSKLGGQPDAYALSGLAKVAKSSRDRSARVVAIRAMAYQVSPERSIPYLEDIAKSSNDEDSMVAIMQLVAMSNSMPSIPTPVRQLAQSSLKRLWDDKTVKSPAGQSTLCDFAASANWDRTGRCGPSRPGR